MPDTESMLPELDELELPGLEDTGPAARNSIRAQLFRLQVRAQRTGKAKLERLADRTLDAFEQLADALDKLEQADRDQPESPSSAPSSRNSPAAHHPTPGSSANGPGPKASTYPHAAAYPPT